MTRERWNRWLAESHSLPRAVAGIMHRPALLIVIGFLLSSCLIAAAPLFDAREAVMIPGIAGKWEQIDSAGAKTTVFLWKHEGQYYRYTEAEKANGAAPTSASVLFIPVRDNYYLMQMGNTDTRDRPVTISLIKVAHGQAVLYDVDSKDLDRHARAVGLTLDTATRKLTASATKAQALKLYSDALAENTEIAKNVLRRAGSFHHEDGANYSVASAKKAIEAKDFAHARKALTYLADRGNGEAQFLLAGLYLEPGATARLDYHRAVAGLTDAYASGFKDAGLVLMHLYRIGPGAQQYDTTPGPRPDVTNGLALAARLARDKDYSNIAENVMKGLAAEKCRGPGGEAATVKCISETIYSKKIDAWVRNAVEVAERNTIAAELRLVNATAKRKKIEHDQAVNRARKEQAEHRLQEAQRRVDSLAAARDSVGVGVSYEGGLSFTHPDNWEVGYYSKQRVNGLRIHGLGVRAPANRGSVYILTIQGEGDEATLIEGVEDLAREHSRNRDKTVGGTRLSPSTFSSVKKSEGWKQPGEAGSYPLEQLTEQFSVSSGDRIVPVSREYMLVTVDRTACFIVAEVFDQSLGQSALPAGFFQIISSLKCALAVIPPS